VKQAGSKPIGAAGRRRGVGTLQVDFAEFYREAKDDCLRTVLVSAGDRDTAQEAGVQRGADHPRPRRGVTESDAG
jgi:hypothetical protein